ncbi:TonB-dependent receptor [Rhizorhabdus dicambivorans]|nr:TonB-dependent receptor [Rhizorhabdus dicambivorans]
MKLISPASLFCGVSTLVLALPAYGQGAAPGQAAAVVARDTVEDIVVTATRRSERLQDVPLAISAITGDQMARRSIMNTTDVVTAVPNMYGSPTNGLRGGTFMFLRGLGTTSPMAFLDPAVSNYVDEVLRPRQNNSTTNFSDIDRIEVLRGPQGTTFGRNSTGGALSITTKKPSPEFQGDVSVTYGSYDEHILRGMINVPLSDSFMIRATGFYDKADGWLTNLTRGDKLMGKKLYGGRVAIRLLPSDGITWDASAEHSRSYGLEIRSFAGQPKITRLEGVLTGGTNDVVADALANRGLRGNVYSTSLASNLAIDLGGADLSLITGYNEFHSPFVYDGSGLSLTSTTATPVPAYQIGDLRGDNFTQEVKITGKLVEDRLTYVAGLFYLTEKDDFILSATANRVVTCSPGSFGDGQVVCPNGQRGYYTTRRGIQKVDSFAGYAQFDFELTPTLTLTGGARYTAEKKTLDAVPVSLGGLAAGGPLTADLVRYGVDTKLKSSILTPKAIIRWKPSGSQMYYASYSQGFKSGGFNLGPTPATSNSLKPEKTRTYEIGGKVELLDRRLTLSGDAFYQLTDNLQLSYSAPNFLVANGAPLPVTKNTGDIRTRGLELEFTAVPFRNLELFGGAAVQGGHYHRVNPDAASFTTAAGVFVKGVDLTNKLVYLPARTFNIGATYEIPADGLAGHFSLTADFRYQSGSWRLATNQVTPIKGYSGPFEVLNLSAGFTMDNGLRLSVECRNCTDNQRIIGTTSSSYYYADPRQILASVGFKF